MTHTTDQELYAQWREDYALTYEPNYDEHLEADCKAAFLAGMQAARRAQVVPSDVDIAELRFNYGITSNGYGIHEFEKVASYTREALRRWTAAPQPPEPLKRENPATKPEANSAEFDRIEAALIPKFNHAAKRKLELLKGDGVTITGYAIENKDGRRGAIDCHGFVYWWNDAEPVQMPEPVAVAFRFETEEYGSTAISFYPSDRIGMGWTALYTEHQVRQLLAQHGIK